MISSRKRRSGNFGAAAEHPTILAIRLAADTDLKHSAEIGLNNGGAWDALK
jgi:hypothetical protein